MARRMDMGISLEQVLGEGERDHHLIPVATSFRITRRMRIGRFTEERFTNMKSPPEFSRTVYLGDRACKCVIIDGWNKRVSIEIDTISRIRDASGQWNYYTAEDIKDGRIVFEAVHRCSIEPQGLLPCDWIDIVSVEPVSDEYPSGTRQCYSFTVSLGAVDEGGNARELTMKIIADGFYLEDPAKPGLKIIS